MDEDLIDNINQLLMPQPCLNLYLFDLEGNIIEDIRQRLIWRIKILFSRTLGQFPGVRLEDAYLCGSSANYLWREKSDFDFWFKINIDTDKFFIKEKRGALKFLGKQLAAHRQAHKNLYGIDMHFLDAKIIHHPLKKLHGVYSLMQNRWIILPQQNMAAEINPQWLYDKTSAEIVQYRQKMDNIKRSENGRVNLSELKKLQRLCNQIIGNQYHTVTDYIIYKLLRRSKITIELYQFIQDETAKTLSIDSPLPED